MAIIKLKIIRYNNVFLYHLNLDPTVYIQRLYKVVYDVGSHISSYLNHNHSCPPPNLFLPTNLIDHFCQRLKITLNYIRKRQTVIFLSWDDLENEPVFTIHVLIVLM